MSTPIPIDPLLILSENLVAHKGLDGFFDPGAHIAELACYIGGYAGLGEHDHHEQFSGGQDAAKSQSRLDPVGNDEVILCGLPTASST